MSGRGLSILLVVLFCAISPLCTSCILKDGSVYGYSSLYSRACYGLFLSVKPVMIALSSWLILLLPWRLIVASFISCSSAFVFVDFVVAEIHLCYALFLITVVHDQDSFSFECFSHEQGFVLDLLFDPTIPRYSQGDRFDLGVLGLWFAIQSSGFIFSSSIKGCLKVSWLQFDTLISLCWGIDFFRVGV